MSQKAGGYKSESIGRQELHGTAIDRIAEANDTNAASKIDNKKWYASVEKNRRRMDKLHERLSKD